MTNVTLAYGRPTLADKVFSRSLVIDLVLIAAGAAFTALMAQLYIPMWPVPITGQTLAVLLVGATLGASRGAISMGLYLVLGLIGLPIYAEGKSGSLLSLPSGGFIIGFIFAAALVGWLAQREWDRKALKTFVAFLAGTVVIYAFGLPWLYFFLNNAGASVWNGAMGYDSVFAATIANGLTPFLIGDLIKALIAAALLPLAWRAVGKADAAKQKQL